MEKPWSRISQAWAPLSPYLLSVFFSTFSLFLYFQPTFHFQPFSLHFQPFAPLSAFLSTFSLSPLFKPFCPQKSPYIYFQSFFYFQPTFHFQPFFPFFPLLAFLTTFSLSLPFQPFSPLLVDSWRMPPNYFSSMNGGESLCCIY